MVDTADKKCRSDVIFVLVESESDTRVNFEKMKSFVSDLISTLDVNTRVGVVCYGADVGEYFNLSAHSSLAAITSAVSSFTSPDDDVRFGRTLTNRVLVHVRTVMLTGAAGDRPAVRNVVVIVTGETLDNTTDTQVCTLMKNFIISETILKLCCTLSKTFVGLQLNNVISGSFQINLHSLGVGDFYSQLQ